MSIAEKLTTIAENEQRVYQAGYDKGVAKGGGSYETDGHFELDVPTPSTTIKSYSDTWTGGISNYAFENYTELETVYAPKAASIGDCAFKGCTKLKNIEVGSQVPTKVFSDEVYYEKGLIYIGSGAFEGCQQLRKCTLYYTDYYDDTYCGYTAFLNCPNLEIIDFQLFRGSLGDCVFQGSTSLRAIVFREEVERFRAYDDFTGAPFQDSTVASGTGYIYVASKFLADYQADWPDYASQFRALEDYTVDGTLEGELDETKI